MEIERKYLIDHPPAGYDSHPSRAIEQAYLCTEPVVRVMVEAPDHDTCERYVDQVIEVMKKRGHML